MKFGHKSIAVTLSIAQGFLFPPLSSWQNESQEPPLVFPGLLKRNELLNGNPLATYAAMLDLDLKYRESPIFAQIYPEIRCNFEEFLGDPLAGMRAMSLPAFRRSAPNPSKLIPESYAPRSALEVIEQQAKKTRIVVWGEEHHLPQTRSLYEPLLRSLWRQGYRYLAAETFSDLVMAPSFEVPDYQSGYYLMDPVFANAVRTARKLGYKLVAYDTTERGTAGDNSFRDRTQAQNISSRIFDRDPKAKAIVIAGRGHASEEAASDGWTPMAHVLKQLTGIDPFTIYAPTMSQRSTPQEEDPYYRFATENGLVQQPTVFVNRAQGGFFGTSAFDAYVFWPRTQIKNGRPDWMTRTLGRKSVKAPRKLVQGSGMRLVQAFPEGAPASAIPTDQVLLSVPNEVPALMLPPGKYWLRSIDRDDKILASASLNVP